MGTHCLPPGPQILVSQPESTLGIILQPLLPSRKSGAAMSWRTSRDSARKAPERLRSCALCLYGGTEAGGQNRLHCRILGHRFQSVPWPQGIKLATSWRPNKRDTGTLVMGKPTVSSSGGRVVRKHPHHPCLLPRPSTPLLPCAFQSS